MTTTIDIREREAALNESILKGDILGALERFYADDCVMQENTEEPCRGKAANRRREEEFLESVAEFHGARLLGSATASDLSFSEWEFDASYRDGVRRKTTQAAVRRWRDGLVVHERFYHA